MSETQIYTGALAMVLAALGMWLMLPRGNQPGRLVGAVFGIASLILFGSLGARMGSTGSEIAFVVVAAVTVVSAAATVSFRSPVYCALWFALSLLGTAALFMMQGAQFLGVATIVVYAGAILVTFLFVLMLAQPTGDAYYDRVSFEGMFAATTGAVMIGFLTMTVVRVLSPYVDPDFIAALDSFRPEETGAIEPEHVRRARLGRSESGDWSMEVELTEEAPVLGDRDQVRLEAHLHGALPAIQENDVMPEDFELILVPARAPVVAMAPTDRAAKGGILTDEHVATLGAQLFSRHLIAIEVAGTLLLVGLVGAIAIVSHGRSSLTPVGAIVRQNAGSRKGH
jgi:NADH-quinone oxidoreductase subunit J